MNIKELRTAAGMTQKAFSEYFGIPKRTVEDWEGERRKCPDYLLDLMEFKLRTVGKIPGTAFITLIEPEKEIEWTEN